MNISPLIYQSASDDAIKAVDRLIRIDTKELSKSFTITPRAASLKRLLNPVTYIKQLKELHHPVDCVFTLLVLGQISEYGEHVIVKNAMHTLKSLY